METTGPDAFPLPADHPRAHEHRQLTALLEEAPIHVDAVTALMRGRQLLRTETERCLPLLLAALERIEHPRAQADATRRRRWDARLSGLITQLALRRLAHDEASITRLLRHAASMPGPAQRAQGAGRPAQLIPALRAYLEDAKLDHASLAERPELLAAALELLETLGRDAGDDLREVRACRELRALLGLDAERLLAPGEVWADALLAELDAMAEEPRAAWRAFVAHCLEASASKPPKRWLAQAESMLDAIGRDQASAALARWLPLVAKGRSAPLPPHERGYDVPDDPGYIIERHQLALRGMAWAASAAPSAELARALGDLARACFAKLRGYGPRASKVGNAAVWGLGAMPGTAAVGQLAVLGARPKSKSVQKQIAKALAAAAAREGVSPEEIEELAVPTHDLREVGRAVERFGDYQAELLVVDSARVRLRWRKGEGKALETVPAPVKREHPEQLEALRARV